MKKCGNECVHEKKEGVHSGGGPTGGAEKIEGIPNGERVRQNGMVRILGERFGFDRSERPGVLIEEEQGKR